MAQTGSNDRGDNPTSVMPTVAGRPGGTGGTDGSTRPTTTRQAPSTTTRTAPPASSRGGPAPSARPRGPRRAKLTVRHINPWTVFKFSCVLSIALFFVWLITVGVLYGLLQGAGVIGRINDTVETINGQGSNPPISSGLVFGGAAVIGVVNMVLFVALSTIGSIIYNLCADLVGGVEVTLSEPEN